ncbi:MAG: hypothetical protein JWS11_407 [Cypionkella sp.]|nr:hypothetical protein [Cypionkella sp.]
MRHCWMTPAFMRLRSMFLLLKSCRGYIWPMDCLSDDAKKLGEVRAEDGNDFFVDLTFERHDGGDQFVGTDPAPF